MTEEGGRDGESRVCDGNGGCDGDGCVMVDMGGVEAKEGIDVMRWQGGGRGGRSHLCQWW